MNPTTSAAAAAAVVVSAVVAAVAAAGRHRLLLLPLLHLWNAHHTGRCLCCQGARLQLRQQIKQENVQASHVSDKVCNSTWVVRWTCMLLQYSCCTTVRQDTPHATMLFGDAAKPCSQP